MPNYTRIIIVNKLSVTHIGSLKLQKQISETQTQFFIQKKHHNDQKRGYQGSNQQTLPVYFISSDDKCLCKHLLCSKLKDFLKCVTTVSASPSLVYLHSHDDPAPAQHQLCVSRESE